jgi:hypothetical protein
VVKGDPRSRTKTKGEDSLSRKNRAIARSRPVYKASRSTILAKPAVVKGDPRLRTKTKGEDSLSRKNRAIAR